MKTLPHLFGNNRHWAETICRRDPEFFSRLAAQQAPQFLWIGCADSRVPANEIVGLLPGELFVHRNVANLVVPSDLNCLAVIQYAVAVLRVRHIIVCGHYGCGGVNAALEPCGAQKLVDEWLGPLRDLAHGRRAELDALPDAVARADRLCELNVAKQVLNVGRTAPVQDAWARGQELCIHGWIYRLTDGRLRDLGLAMAAAAELQAWEKAELSGSHPETSA